MKTRVLQISTGLAAGMTFLGMLLCIGACYFAFRYGEKCVCPAYLLLCHPNLSCRSKHFHISF